MVAALPCHAQQPNKSWMTGARLLAMMTFPPSVKGNFDMTPEQYTDSERAGSYIEGVHDMSAGRSWCNNERYPANPDTLRDAVVIGLRTLPPEQLKRSAADLIVEIWGKRWPCTGRRDSR
jgi:hypothetical protein